MTDIPDEVVERSLTEYWGVSWFGAAKNPDRKYQLDQMRAAGRVFVEWERGECARTVKEMFVFSGDETLRRCEKATILDAAAAILARSEGE